MNLPLTGTLVGIEPRTGGASNNHTVVFTFEGASASNPLVSGTASVTGGTASIASTQFAGNEMIVNLTGAVNLQTVTVTLSNIAAQNGQTVASGQASMGILRNDVDYSRAVNVGDTVRAKTSSSEDLGLTNFRADVDLSGRSNVGDVVQVKSSSGTLLP